MSKIPKALSPGEETLAGHLRAYRIPFEREYSISPKTKHRFDFALPNQKILIEIQGSIWTNGRHSRGKGFESDCRKSNLAVFLGWRLLKYSTEMVMDGSAINDILALRGIVLT